VPDEQVVIDLRGAGTAADGAVEFDPGARELAHVLGETRAARHGLRTVAGGREDVIGHFGLHAFSDSESVECWDVTLEGRPSQVSEAELLQNSRLNRLSAEFQRRREGHGALGVMGFSGRRSRGSSPPLTR